MQNVRRILGYLFNSDAYQTVVEQARARLVYSIVGYITLAFSLYAFLSPHWVSGSEVLTLWEYANTGANYFGIWFLAVYGLGIGAVYSVNQERLELGCWLLLAQWGFAGPLIGVYAQDTLFALGMPLAQWIMMAVLIKSEAGLYAITIISALFVGVAVVINPALLDEEIVGLLVLNILSVGMIFWVFLRFFRQSLSARVDDVLAEQSSINAIVRYGTDLSSQTLTSAQIAHKICEKTTHSFKEVEQVQIFLLNEAGGEANLFADSKTPVLEHKVRYGVGGVSAVGQVASHGKPVIERMDNTPLTRGVFALNIGNRIFGVMSLHSREARLFEQEASLDAFRSLGEAVALLLANILQFELAHERVKSNADQMQQLKQELSEAKRQSQRLTSNLWSQHFRDLEDGISLSVDFENSEKQPQASWTQPLSQAVKGNQLVHTQNDHSQVVAVPLRVRGQVIGAMEFELDSQSSFTPEDMELLQEVSERFGLAAENSRLLEDSQRAAQREAIVNQISAKLQTSTGVNSTLTEAARGLREALKAGKVAIRLGTPGEGGKRA